MPPITGNLEHRYWYRFVTNTQSVMIDLSFVFHTHALQRLVGPPSHITSGETDMLRLLSLPPTQPMLSWPQDLGGGAFFICVTA